MGVVKLSTYLERAQNRGASLIWSTMYTFHSSNAAQLDSYSVGVLHLAEFVEERFPERPELLKISHALRLLERKTEASLLTETEQVQFLLMMLADALSNRATARRDFLLTMDKIRYCEKLERDHSQVILALDGALREARLDSVVAEEPRLLVLYELRDSLMESNNDLANLRAFVDEYRALMEARRTRGWPSWRNLEHHCSRLESFFSLVCV